MNYILDSQEMGILAAWARRLKMKTRIDSTDLKICGNALQDVLDAAVGENGRSWKENTTIKNGE